MTTADLHEMPLLDLFLMETDAQCLNLNRELGRWGAVPSPLDSVQYPLEGGSASSPPPPVRQQRGLNKALPSPASGRGGAAEGDDGGGPDFSAMQRAIHSITGAARLVDLQPIIDLTQAMEHGLMIAAANPTPESRQPLESAVNQLSQLAQVKANQLLDALEERKGILSNLAYQLRKQGTSTPSPAEGESPALVSDQPVLGGQGLFQIFTEDAENQLAVLSDNLIQIEKTPQAGVLLESSMRAAHSLKGAARIIGLTGIVTLTHNMEDIFIAAQDGVLTLSSGHIDTLFTAADLVRDLIKQDEAAIPRWFEENTPAIATLVDQLQHLAGGAPVFNPAPRPGKKGHKAAAAAPPGKEKLPTDQRRQRPQPTTSSDRHLRVSAQGMSRILALASEAMIESRWLPQITSSIGRLKRRQDEIWYALEKIRTQLPADGVPATLDSSLSDITVKIKRCQDVLSNQIDELTEHSTHSVNIAHRLHHEVISNRMQPLSEGLIGLPRLVRDLSRKLGKTVRLEVIGSETKIDRDIMDKLESPFIHLVTNAIDHGVEDPAHRAKIGKPPEATLRITAKHHAGMLIITVTDDGRGLNYEALRQKAVDRRMVTPKIAAELTESELAEFLFLPKFTTRESADSTSGRGVGLDIVNNTIREIRGSIQLRSIPNHGLTFELHLPLTLSIIRGLLVEIKKEPYALPLVNIDHVIRLSRSDIKEIGNRQYFLSNNKQVYIITAQQTLDLKEHELNDDTLSVIVVSSINTTYGLIVDRFLGIRDLVVQPLSPRLGKLKSISAAAIAEDGTPILILDINDLRQSMDHLISDDRLQRIEPQISGRGPSHHKRILVVDDSITVREVERKVLTEHGFEVEVAVDGIEAWNLIRKSTPFNLIITDIDMPNMDGIELLVHIKESKEHENIPVIILSYKDREADRTRGLDAGADYYLTKSSFRDQALIEAVEDLIGEPGERR